MLRPIVILACLTSWCINMLLMKIVDALPSVGIQLCVCVVLAMLSVFGMMNALKLQMSSEDMYYGAVVASVGALLICICKALTLLTLLFV